MNSPVPQNKKKRAAQKVAYIDFDGSHLAVGTQYRGYKGEEKLRRMRITGVCKHPAVMITIRCQICGRVHVYTVLDWPNPDAIIGRPVQRLNEITYDPDTHTN
jgi:hypothetical protein